MTQYNLVTTDNSIFLTGDNLEAALEIQEALREYAEIDVEIEENE